MRPARYYLGLDIGGTKVAAGVVDADGRVLSRTRAATAELRGGGDPLAGILRLGEAALASADAGCRAVSGVGVALPGPADPAGLRLLAAPTIPELAGRPLGEILERTFGCPAAGDNDANACALGEARFGAGRQHRHVVYITVSTGIGGGIVFDGRVFPGASGTSAEVGHQVIIPTGGPPCDCGSTGCLEALASGRGIAARARRALPDVETPTAEAVAEAARAGSLAALEVWRETALYLGIGISNVINLLDPDIVVLGGGVIAGAADLLLPPLRQVVHQRCMPSLGRRTPVAPASLGADVGIVGAASLAMQ